MSFFSDKSNGSYSEFQVMRYMPWRSFEHLVKEQSLTLFNCPAFEDTDFFEGKTTDSYRAVLKRAIELESQHQLAEDAEQEFRLLLSDLEIHRQHTYVSCWTTELREDPRMWNTFANPGVIIKTTQGNLLEQLMNFAKPFGPLDNVYDHFQVEAGEIKYDREQMHTGLDSENYFSYWHPIFHLSGSEGESFSHEKEFRFAMVNNKEFFKTQNELLPIIANKSDFNLENKVREIEVPFNLSLIHEIVVPQNLKSHVEKLLQDTSNIRASVELSTCH